jgi:hypothetical protein
MMLVPKGYLAAQFIAPQINSSGNLSYLSPEQYVDMSIGELAITTLEGSDNIITQGFLQPIRIDQPCATPELTYYPNPVVDMMELKAVDCDVQIGMVEAVDLFGKSSLIAYPVENVVDLTAIGVGIYILKVFNTSQQLIGSIKIVKISA